MPWPKKAPVLKHYYFTYFDYNGVKQARGPYSLKEATRRATDRRVLYLNEQDVYLHSLADFVTVVEGKPEAGIQDG